MFRPSKPFHTGINAFDHHYGRHARGGDAWMFFGTSAAGTTLLASQTAGHTAQQGKLVAYITTTSRQFEILLRAYSSVTAIPLEELKTIEGSEGNHPLLADLSRWFDGFGKNLVTCDYPSAPGSSFEEKYRHILNAVLDAHGRFPDLTVLDDLDMVVPTGFTDHIEKRDAYDAAAAIVARTAGEFDHVVVVVARANKEGSGKGELTERDTAESTSLHEQMSGMAGVTSIPGNGDLVYKNDQHLVVCKCPRGQDTLSIMIEREFERAMFRGASLTGNEPLTPATVSD